MKQSGYRTVFHIYLIFFLSLLGAVLLAGVLFLQTIFIRTPNGTSVRSDWPRKFTEEFHNQVIFPDDTPRIKQAGIELLLENEVGIQILDASGREVSSYQRPEQAPTDYSSAELLQLLQTGKLGNSTMTTFTGTVSNAGEQYIYLLYFPVNISKVTMYVGGDRFAGGKAILLPILSVLLLFVLILGVVYGLYTTKAMKRLTAAVREIADRSYLPMQDHGVFHDLYDSLNTLDSEIRNSDQLRTQTEKMREEWIANITHDLKTPLSPIKGYAELLHETGGGDREQCRRYAGIMLKNASYMEALIDDLKLTYQLENGMLPIHREEQNVVRFLKELAITILNTPEFERRTIHFESAEGALLFPFDQTLLTRAFRNLIINAFVHGDDHTEATLRIAATATTLQVVIADNGPGMSPEVAEHLFDRYYRGTNTEQNPEGTGLGLAIAKGIVELHGGRITVASIPAVGTTFHIDFPFC